MVYCTRVGIKADPSCLHNDVLMLSEGHEVLRLPSASRGDRRGRGGLKQTGTWPALLAAGSPASKNT